MTYTTLLSCFSNLLVNSFKISKKGKREGALVGSSHSSTAVTLNNIPLLCKAVTASRFFTASKPKDKAKRFANS